MAALNQVPSLIGGGQNSNSGDELQRQSSLQELSWTKREFHQKLRPYLKDDLPKLILLTIASVLSALCNLLAPYYIAQGIDLVAHSTFSWSEFRPILIKLGLSITLRFVFDLIIHTKVPEINQRVLARIRAAAQDRLSKLPLSELDQHAVGDLVSRLTNDLDALQDGLQLVLVQLFSGLVSLIGAFILILIFDWRIALLVLALTPFNYIVTHFISKRSHDLYLTNGVLTGDVNTMIEELTGEQKLLRAFGYEPIARKTFNERNQELYENGQKAQFISSLTNPASRFVNNLLYIAVGTLACYLGFKGLLTIGQISALLNYALQYTKPVNELSTVLTEVQRGYAGGERALRIMELEPADPESHKPDLKVTDGAIEFKDLSFSYVPEKPLIQHFSQKIPGGTKVAIVGPTGAGKTTLVNLLMRYYDYQEGAILIDGQPIDQCNRDSVRDAFGMVLQETWLFAGSVHANIAYAKPSATREEVIAAAKAAH